MIIRRMRPEDAKEVAVIEKEVFSLPWSEKSFGDALLKETNIYVVAEEDGIIVGYAGAWGVFGEADITNVCVKPDCRRRGIAEKLLSFLMEEGKKMEINIYFLEVRESNTAAIALYKKLGFRNIGVRKNFYEKPVENGIVMSLT